MAGLANERVMTVGLAGLGIYFSILLTRGLLGYLRFRRVRPTALVTWPVPRPPNFGLLLALGALGVVVTVVNTFLDRPFHHILGLGAMALYFVLMVPLARTIELGFYRDGVWADGGFVPYRDIARLAFRETPEIVLLLLPRGQAAPFHLPVPRGEYGAVRKLLEEKIRARVVCTDEAILGL